MKVLGVPPEASAQSLREAMVHHGTVQSARLTPTKSGAGFVGYVTYQSSASGKDALEAGYGFHGKEQIRIVHPAITKEMESATPRPQLRLTNLPPNTTDWELHSIMTEVQAINWHVPRIPREGMTHLHSCYALVEFPDSVTCQQAAETSYQLRGYKLLWYHPSVITCYRCGGHGHLQASCPVKAKVTQVGCMGAHQDGVSYATAVQPGVNTTKQQKTQLHTSSGNAQPAVLDGSYSGQTTTAWLDALELQIGVLSKSFQVLLARIDSVTEAVASVGQAVEVIARKVSVPSPVVSVTRGMATDTGVLGVEAMPQVADAGPQASTQVVVLPLYPARGSGTAVKPTLNVSPGVSNGLELGQLPPGHLCISNMESSTLPPPSSTRDKIATIQATVVGPPVRSISSGMDVVAPDHV